MVYYRITKLNKEEMNAYDRRSVEADLKYRGDWKNAMDFAVKEAVEKTKEETSRRKQLEIAKNFKQAGVAPDIVAQSTGLSLDEINVL